MVSIGLVSPPMDGRNGIGNYTASLTAALNADYTVITLPTESVNPFSYFTTAVRVGNSDHDVVHLQYEYGLFGPLSLYWLLFVPVLYLLIKIRGQPVVVTMHESLNAEVVDAPLRQLKALYIRLLNGTIAGLADHIVFLSETSERRFRHSVNITTFSTLSHGVQTETLDMDRAAARREFDHESTAPLIVEPGYVTPRKGTHLLVKLAKTVPNLSFLIAGGPSSGKDSYFEWIRRNSPENVTVTGVLQDRPFHAAFIAADLVVLPYAPTTDGAIINKVNQSGVFNLCVAYQVPVVASDCEYFKNIQESYDCVVTTDIKDLEAFRITIESVLDDEARCQRLRENMAAFERENSFKRVAAKHVSLYQTLSG